MRLIGTTSEALILHTSTMFSTLLSRPKHSEYDPSYHFIPLLNPSSSSSSAPPLSQQSTQPQSLDQEGSKYDSTIPLKKRFPNLLHNFPKPEPDQELINQTKQVFDNLLNPDEPTNDTNYITYSNTNEQSQSGGANDEKVIQIKTFEVDPMLPPTHKLRKNRHDRVVDEDLTIIKDVNAKRLTKEDRTYWNIPAAVSNWKNSQGFTIGLDKRMIGREVENSGNGGMNIEKFGELSNALSSADRKAREEIKLRNEAREQQQLNEKRLRNEKIREIASRTKRRKY